MVYEVTRLLRRAVNSRSVSGDSPSRSELESDGGVTFEAMLQGASAVAYALHAKLPWTLNASINASADEMKVSLKTEKR